MKTTTVTRASNENLQGRLTIGLDLGDRSSCYRVVDEAGEVIHEQKVRMCVRVSLGTDHKRNL